MAQLEYSNPQGATDSFPFPTDPAKKIYYQEVNNMFEQVRAHINNGLGVDNFDLPFTRTIPWSITSGEAIDITTQASAPALAINHSLNALLTGALAIDSDTANPTTASIISLKQSNAAAQAPFARFETSSSISEVPYLVIQDGAAVEQWGLYKTATGSKFTSPAGKDYQFHVDGTAYLTIDNTGITTNGDIDATTFTAGASVFSSESLNLDGPVLSKEDADTFLLENKLRFGTASTGPLFYQSAGNNLIVDAIFQFGNPTDGPKIYRASPNTMRVERALEINDTSNSVVLSPSSNALNVNKNTISANGKTVVMGSDSTPTLIAHARVRSDSGGLLSDSSNRGIEFVSDNGDSQFTMRALGFGTTSTPNPKRPVIQLTTEFDGANFTTEQPLAHILNANFDGSGYYFTVQVNRAHTDNLNPPDVPGNATEIDSLKINITVIGDRV